MIARIVAVALCALAAVATAWPAGAEAGVYAFGVCDDGNGAGSNFAFDGSVYGRGTVRGCTAGEGLHTEANAGGGGPLYFPEGAYLSFCPPSGTRVVRYAADTLTQWAGSGFAAKVDGGPCGGYQPIGGYSYAPSFGQSDFVALGGYTDAGGLRLGSYCEWSPCQGTHLATNWEDIKVALSDVVAPSVEVRGGSAWSDGWLRGDHPLAWSASDSAGLKYLYAQVLEPRGGVEQNWTLRDNTTGACGPVRSWDYDGAAIPLYDKPVPCPVSDRAEMTLRTAGLADGRWTLQALAIDTAGNRGGPSRALQVDNTAPAATLDRAEGSWSPAVTWTVADAHAGVDGGSLTASYSTDGGAVWHAMSGGSWDAAAGKFTATVPPAAGDGGVVVRVTGADNARPGGNPFTGAAAAIRVDTGGPAVSVRGAGSPAVPHPGPVAVTLLARDGGAGMGEGAHVAWSLDGSDWMLVPGDEARIEIAGEGDHTLSWYAVDAVGNRSERQTRTIVIRPGAIGAGPAAGFSDRSANPRTTFTAATRFGEPCPAGATLAADRDGSAGDRDTFVGFPLPPAPDCTVASARLRLYASAVVAGRPIDASRASAAWDELGLTAATRPGVVGAASRAASPDAPGWVEWDVTDQVQALYRLGDNGLALRDAAPPGGGAVVFCLRDSAAADCAGRAPQLVVGYTE